MPGASETSPTAVSVIASVRNEAAAFLPAWLKACQQSSVSSVFFKKRAGGVDSVDVATHHPEQHPARQAILMALAANVSLRPAPHAGDLSSGFCPQPFNSTSQLTLLPEMLLPPLLPLSSGSGGCTDCATESLQIHASSDMLRYQRPLEPSRLHLVPSWWHRQLAGASVVNWPCGGFITCRVGSGLVNWLRGRYITSQLNDKLRWLRGRCITVPAVARPPGSARCC